MIKNLLFRSKLSSRFCTVKSPHFSLLVKPEKAKIVGGWLLVTAFGVFSMIIVGGYTRLTHSGLSIVDWSPYTKKYPKDVNQWEVEFNKYKDSIEYQTVNRRMDLQQFKSIYTVEYVHRKIGVYLGYLFAFPLGYFVYKKYLGQKMIRRLFILLGLGGSQGAIGYWMVKSGVKQKADYQNRPRVSPYRLSMHLMMATTIYSGLLWTSLQILMKPISEIASIAQQTAIKRTRVIGIVLIHCILFNIFSGALVAGIDAGKVYNTWPLMNNQIIPSGITQKEPFWKNFFQNKAMVQFNHRNMAYITQSVSMWLAYVLYKNKTILPKRIQFVSLLAFAMINYQALSGILTLLNLVPPKRANLHQMTAILTLSTSILLVYVCRIPAHLIVL